MSDEKTPANKRQFGFLALAKKSLAVIAASIGTLVPQESKAIPITNDIDAGSKNLNYESFQKQILKSKLVLKLNPYYPDQSFLAMHKSHSSHRSHSSHYSSSGSGHSSHTSHSSHYSSSPSTTTYTTSTYTPSSTTPSNNNNSSGKSNSNSSNKGNNNSGTNEITIYELGDRTLYKGLKGGDVIELQQFLIALGYNLTATGYFGEQTESAIKNFQSLKGLPNTGIADIQTISALKK